MLVVHCTTVLQYTVEQDDQAESERETETDRERELDIYPCIQRLRIRKLLAPLTLLSTAGGLF